ncbi:hypothetical protein MKEN_00674200 [Mycena kentingensis (nom. inval.)]|nr:hypothetical protein MKEN_00674200 [Mycena kentingensis (nom. inval.)]
MVNQTMMNLRKRRLPPLSPLVLNPETFALHLMTPAGEGPLRNATIQPEFVHDYHDRNDLTPASAQDVADLLADMAAMSAQNRTQIARAAAVKAEADRMNKVVDGMRHQVIIERTRRERAEAYWKYWRETAKEWSDAEIWSGQMTIAPVEVRFPEDVNKKPRTYTLMEMEVDTSDDERLKKQWKKKDARFKKRRREQVAAKAQARNVPVEAVSDVETTTTEEEFYSPFVLDDGREDVPESEQFVHRMMPESRGVMFPPLDGGGTIIHQHGQRRLEDGEMRAGKRPRRGQVTKRIAGLEDGEDIENFEARVAEAAGVYWDGTGDYEGGWV